MICGDPAPRGQAHTEAIGWAGRDRLPHTPRPDRKVHPVVESAVFAVFPVSVRRLT
ncbi:hypothetical protein GCM10010521_00280 [Streptomyces rameus]|uniref:Uncharacterized protein n=1 Tax=Streptomyces rameus TaxID=68261 RepID=A0ABP6MJ73_9ACTN